MKYYFAIIAFALTILVIGVRLNPKQTSQGTNFLGSTVTGSDYYSTSTRSFNGTSLTNLTVLKSRPGALARVTITGANTGILRFWDATTTDVTQRTPGLASTSILIAEIPASAVANVYDFDAQFNYGLIYELVAGLAPTSTPIWR